jgi:High potential iron-sulfur protein
MDQRVTQDEERFMLENKIARRALLKGALASLAAIPVLGLSSQAVAAGAGNVDPNDAQAKGLGFVLDASKVDAKTHTTYKPGQKCQNCTLFQGKATDAAGPCGIFGGKNVPANGWCQAYAKKA